MELHAPIRNLSLDTAERDAKRAVVDAVEERWNRQDRQRRRAAFRKAFRSLSAGLILLTIAGVAAYWFLGGHDDIIQTVDAARSNILSDGEAVHVDASPLVPAPLLDPKPAKPLVERAKKAVAAQQDPTDAFRKCYLDLVMAFRAKPVSPWKSAPADIRLKNAPKGTVYHALVPRRPAGYDIYEMTTTDKGLTYWLLSPIAEPVQVVSADFTTACKGTCYLIECKGLVYVGGKATEADVVRLQERLAP